MISASVLYPVGSGCGLVTPCDLAVGVGIVEGAESEQRLEGAIGVRRRLWRETYSSR